MHWVEITKRCVSARIKSRDKDVLHPRQSVHWYLQQFASLLIEDDDANAPKKKSVSFSNLSSNMCIC